MNTRVVDLYLRLTRINVSHCALYATFAIVGFLIVAQPASAATILVNADGKLIGATGVNVQGSLYDVAFVDGTCIERFSGCDAAADFTFTTVSSALAASQALLDQVFLGSFDTAPNLTLGCVDVNHCQTFTPYATVINALGENVVLLGNAFNGRDSLPDGAYQSSLLATTDLGGPPVGSFLVYADFTPATAVPEPASMLLLGTGLLGAGLRRWRQKRS